MSCQGLNMALNLYTLHKHSYQMMEPMHFSMMYRCSIRAKQPTQLGSPCINFGLYTFLLSKQYISSSQRLSQLGRNQRTKFNRYLQIYLRHNPCKHCLPVLKFHHKSCR